MENNKVKLIINKEDTSVPVKVILMPYAAFADPENPTSAEAADWMVANVEEEDWTGSLVIYRTPTEDTYMHEIDYNWVWEVSKTDDGFINIITIEKRNNNFPKTIVWTAYSSDGITVTINTIFNNTGRTLSFGSGAFSLTGGYTNNYIVLGCQTETFSNDFAASYSKKNSTSVGITFNDGIDSIANIASSISTALVFKIEIYE